MTASAFTTSICDNRRNYNILLLTILLVILLLLLLLCNLLLTHSPRRGSGWNERQRGRKFQCMCYLRTVLHTTCLASAKEFFDSPLLFCLLTPAPAQSLGVCTREVASEGACETQKECQRHDVCGWVCLFCMREHIYARMRGEYSETDLSDAA